MSLLIKKHMCIFNYIEIYVFKKINDIYKIIMLNIK